MKKLDINITKATIQSFSVDAEDGKPVISVTLALMTEGGKVITHYTIDNNSWRSDPLDIPLEAMPIIGSLITVLEGAAVRHCRDSQKALPVPKKEEAESTETEIEEEPIDLSEVPFDPEPEAA